MRKRGLVIVILLLSAMTCHSQEWTRFHYPRKHNISLGMDGGLGGILINKSIFPPTAYSWSAGGSLLYTRMMNDEVGLQFGFGARCVTGAFNGKDLTSEYMSTISITDGDYYRDEDARFVYVSPNVHESYTMEMVEIPVRILYTVDNRYLAAGVKLGLPLTMTADYDYSEGVIGISEVIGTGTELDEVLPTGSFPARSGSYEVCGFLNEKPALFVDLSIEAGLRITLGGTHSMMVGIFADYALNRNKVGCEGDEDFISFEDGVPTYRTCMGSNVVEGFGYLSAGLKLTYQFGFGNEVGNDHVRIRQQVAHTTWIERYIAKLKLRKRLRSGRRYKFFWQ